MSDIQRFPQDVEGKIEMAKSYKEKGNQNFKENQYKKAISNYSKGLAFTKGLPGRTQGMDGMTKMAAEQSSERLSAEVSSAVDELDVVLKTNIATCYIKLEDYEKAMENIKEALELNPSAWKAHLRKAEAIMILKDYEKSLTVLDIAFQHAPDEPARIAVQKARDRANKLLKDQNAKQKKAFGKLFERARETYGEEDRSES